MQSGSYIIACVKVLTCPRSQKGALKLNQDYLVLFSERLRLLDMVSLNPHTGQTSGKVTEIITKVSYILDHRAIL